MILIPITDGRDGLIKVRLAGDGSNGGVDAGVAVPAMDRKVRIIIWVVDVPDEIHQVLVVDNYILGVALGRVGEDVF